jgi:hypothetical protein
MSYVGLSPQQRVRRLVQPIYKDLQRPLRFRSFDGIAHREPFGYDRETGQSNCQEDCPANSAGLLANSRLAFFRRRVVFTSKPIAPISVPRDETGSGINERLSIDCR